MGSRRATLPILLLVTISVTAPTSVAAEPETARQAFAAWEAERTVSFARASESVTSHGPSIGSVGTLGCLGAEGACIGAGMIEVLEPDDFEVDLALQAGTLHMSAAGSPVSISWTGEGLHEAVVEPQPRVDLSREAASAGALLGADVSDPELSFLAESAGLDPDAPLLVGYAVGEHRGPRYADGLAGGTGGRCISFKKNERRFARAIDRERVGEGLDDLRLDADLGKVARKHTAEMIDQNLLHHTTQEQMLDRIIGWDVLGENVGVGGTVRSLHDAFMASPPHRKNVLYRRYKRIGVGVGRGHDRMWVTIIFQDGDNPSTSLRCN